MHPGATACRIWASTALCLAARVLSAGEEGQSVGAGAPESPAAEYVVERVAAMPQVTVRAILQTRDGYLWLGTYKGLIRFDGVRSITFDVANTSALSSDAVCVLHEDRSGDLWIGTDDGGVIRYSQGEFQAFGAQQGLTESEVRAICEDREGKLWVGTTRGLLYRVKEQFAAFATTNLTANAKITILVPAPDGSLWIGTSKGLFRLRDGNTEPVPELTNRYVHGLAMDSHGVLWAAMDSMRNVRIIPQPGGTQVQGWPFRYGWYQMGRAGTFWFAGYSAPTWSLTGTLFRQEGLTNTAVMAHFEHRKLTSLCEDSDGNTWVGLESHGLYRVRRKQVRTISTRDGLPIDNITTILEDRNGRVWLGTFGRALYASESGTVKFQPVRIPTVVNITAMLERADGTLSVGTYNGRYYRGDGTNFVLAHTGHGCRAIREDREGGFWVGTLTHGVEHYRQGMLTRYTVRDGLASDHIQSLIQDAGGDMWVGTLRGLNRISGGRVIRFHGDDLFARKTVRALHVDPRGAVWIGTLGSGLARIWKNQVQIITARHGLPSDDIEQIIEDDDGNLWLGTWAGIARVSRQDLEACAEGRQSFVTPMTLGPEDGMLSLACGTGFQPSCMKTRSGTLWFCTPGGLVVVDPKTIKPATQPPPVYIEEATADDRSLALRKRSVTVPPSVRRVSFHYTALSFSAPEKILFRYRLEGYDDEWVNAGAAREATYTRLPAGEYQFRVTAGNKDGVWNTAGAMLGVIVVPPWWRTWWATTTGALLFVAGFAGIVRAHAVRTYRRRMAALERQQALERERTRIARDMHDGLGSSMVKIAMLGELLEDNLRTDRVEHEGEQVRSQARKLTAAARQVVREMDEVVWTVNPKNDTLENLAGYIGQFAREHFADTGIECHLEIPTELPNYLLTAEVRHNIFLAAKEALNNILRHAHASEVWVRLQTDGSELTISIQDNGRGLGRSDPARAGAGHGRENMEQRLSRIGGRLTIESQTGQTGHGTQLTMTVPLES